MVHVLGYFPPHVGGVEYCASNHSRELIRRGIDVTVLTSDVDDTDTTIHAGVEPASPDSPEVHRLRSKEFAHTPFIPSLPWKLWHESRGALIHLHISHVWTDIVGTVVATIGRRPLVSHVHMDTPESGRLGFLFLWYKRWILGWLLRQAGAVIALTDEQGEMVSRRYRVPASRVQVVHNGVNEEYFERLPDAASVGADGPLRLLFVGRLAAQKDLPLLISAVEALDGAATLDVVGDGELRDEIAERIVGLPDGQVRMWGALSGAALIERYRNADVFVMTSVREGMPLAALEAMATGLPVVASDVQGLREFVRGVGVLVSERNGQAFAAAIRALAEDPERRVNLGAASREAALLCRWDALTDGLLAAYALAGGRTWDGAAPKRPH